VASGRVLQVNVSRGGVPKSPIPEGLVRPLGLDGDGHRGDTVHGGPHRAVCLLAIEAIRRVAAEGHPIVPGSIGENITTEGIELSELPPGTRLAIGDEVCLELSWAAMPCDTIVDSFRDGRSGRVSILRHPRDSRMYARVLHGGRLRPGDPIDVQPPGASSEALAHLLLNRIELVEQFSDVSRWEAATASGFPVAIMDRGDLYAGASRALDGPVFNNAGGLRTLPHHLERVLDHFRRHGRGGWLAYESVPWPGAIPEFSGIVLTGSLDTPSGDWQPHPSVAVRTVEVTSIADIETFVDLDRQAFEQVGVEAEAWRRLLPGLLRAHGHHGFIAELDGTPVGVGLLIARGRIALLRAAGVIPSARGRGVQGALIGARIAAARELRVDLIASTAGTTNRASIRNLKAAGLRPIWRRDYFHFAPDEPTAGATG
jgi:MOSC domain-containing protein YiiM/GNAT superfamily N-acetyltransferase